MGTFQQSNEIGKAGESVLHRYWSSKGYTVIDLSSNRNAQSIDIDVVIATGNGEYMVDVKSDTHSQKNFFIELTSNCNTNSLGCAHVSKADRWYYYFPNDDMCYIFNPQEMLQWVAENNFREVYTSTYGRSGEVLYKTLGVLVPISSCRPVQGVIRPLEHLAAHENETY